MMLDRQPALICCGDATIADALRMACADKSSAAALKKVPIALLQEVTPAKSESRNSAVPHAPIPLATDDPVTIIYTSGTSGDAKGVVLTVGNVTHMLRCTTERLDQLMGSSAGNHVRPITYSITCHFALQDRGYCCCPAFRAIVCCGFQLI